MSRDRVVWLEYRTGCWHAYEMGRPRSVCGLTTRRGGGKAAPDPNGRHCRRCLRALEDRGLPCPTSCAPEMCSCAQHRAWRREDAETYARAVATCLNRWVDRRVRSWPGAINHVAAAEDRLAGLLLAWELSGEPRAALNAELNDAERGLYEAWRTAERAFDVYGSPGAG